MFNVTVDEINHRVKFDYFNSSMRNDKYGIATICEIDNSFEFWDGIAICSKNDNFCRNTGRKIALGRALQKLYPDDRSKRKPFWDAYFETRHGKW